MPRTTIKSRVVGVVEEWHLPGTEPARPTNKRLSGLWIRNRGLTYGDDAKAGLKRRLDKKFRHFDLGLTVASFNTIKTVQDVVDYIEAL